MLGTHLIYLLSKALVAAKPDCMLFAPIFRFAPDDSNAEGNESFSPFLLGTGCRFLKWLIFTKTLGADTNGVLTRTVFIAKIARVKRVAGQD